MFGRANGYGRQGCTLGPGAPTADPKDVMARLVPALGRAIWKPDQTSLSSSANDSVVIKINPLGMRLLGLW